MDLDNIEDALRQKHWLLTKTPNEVFDAVADAERGDWRDDLAA